MQIAYGPADTTATHYLLLQISCFCKIEIGFTFPVPAHQGSPRQRALNGCCCCYWCHTAVTNRVRFDPGISHSAVMHATGRPQWRDISNDLIQKNYRMNRLRSLCSKGKLSNLCTCNFSKASGSLVWVFAVQQDGHLAPRKPALIILKRCILRYLAKSGLLFKKESSTKGET